MNDTIFVLGTYLIHKHWTEEYYPVVRRVRGQRGYFPSLSRAENAIGELVSKYENHPGRTPYAFLVSEVPYDLAFNREVIYERLYNAEGKLVDAIRCEGWASFGIDKSPQTVPPAEGREESQIRFKLGSLVEYLDPQSATSELMVVIREPFSIDRIKKWNTKVLGPLPMEDFADMYKCVSADGQSSRLCLPTRLIKPTLPLTESLKARLAKNFSDRYSR